MFALKIVVSTVVMGVAVYFAGYFAENMGKIMSVAVPVAVGVITYFVFCAICRVREISELTGMVKSILKRGVKNE